MYRMSKEFSFCAAHRLQRHKGKCRFIHGHNYRVTVSLQAPELNNQGMVLDFSGLKGIVKEYLDYDYDHRLILESTDPMLRVMADGLEEEQYRNIKVMGSAPTAENMAKQFFDDISHMVADIYGHATGLEVVEVRVEETDGASALYSEYRPGQIEISKGGE